MIIDFFGSSPQQFSAHNFPTTFTFRWGDTICPIKHNHSDYFSIAMRLMMFEHVVSKKYSFVFPVEESSLFYYYFDGHAFICPLKVSPPMNNFWFLDMFPSPASNKK